MKASLLALVSCVVICMSGATFAWSDEGGCANGSCSGDSEGACNPYESNCQCTDPSCSRPWDSDCISRAECCEAFGNVGGR